MLFPPKSDHVYRSRSDPIRGIGQDLSFSHRFGWEGSLPVAAAPVLVPQLVPPSHHAFMHDSRISAVGWCLLMAFQRQLRNRLGLKLLSSGRMREAPSCRGRAGPSSSVGHPSPPCHALGMIRAAQVRSARAMCSLLGHPPLPSISAYHLPCCPLPLVAAGSTKLPI